MNPPQDKMKKEIETMMDIYEIYELSEESGLQEQFEEDIKRLIKQAKSETLKKVFEGIENFDFEKLKRKYKPNMDVIKLIKEELKKELKELEKKE